MEHAQSCHAQNRLFMEERIMNYFVDIDTLVHHVDDVRGE
jgi:hypothetical protein